MGISSKLFYQPGNPENTLHYQIRLTEFQFNYQKKQREKLEKFLQSTLSKDGMQIKTRIQGSYKLYTQIRPINHRHGYDSDLGIYFSHSDKIENITKVASEIRSEIYDCLTKYKNSNSEKIEISNPKEHCVKVTFQNNFSIDVTAYLEGPNTCKIIKKNGDLVDSSPEIFSNWCKSKFNDLGNYARIRRIIRYLKLYFNLRSNGGIGMAPSSIFLTVLVLNSIDNNIKDMDGIDGDDELLLWVVRKIEWYLNNLDSGRVYHPIHKKENINRMNNNGFDSFRKNIKKLKDLCNQALNAPNIYSSSFIWANVFDHFMPSAINSKEDLLESYQSNSLQQLNVNTTLISGNKIEHTDGDKLSGPINSKLTFNLSWQNLPRTAKIYWIVRNFGDNIDKNNDCGHISTNNNTVKEVIKYIGTHYMEVIAVVGNDVVGIKKIKVIGTK